MIPALSAIITTTKLAGNEVLYYTSSSRETKAIPLSMVVVYPLPQPPFLRCFWNLGGSLLGGSWVIFICGVISKISILISHIRGLITLMQEPD